MSDMESSTPPLRILHLEDNPQDAELVCAVLESDNLRCQITRIHTRAQFEAAIAAKAHDLILSDYALPQFDGLTALKIAQAVLPDVPFILVSGTIGDDLAVESLKLGACDYVLKDRPERLPSAVRRAVSDAAKQIERRFAAERIAEQAALLDQTHDAILVRDLDQRITYWNKGAERLYEWTAGEAVGKTADELLGSDANASNDEIHRRLIDEGEWTGEVRQVTKTGRTIVVDSRKSLVRDTESNPRAVLIINTDITERKQAALALAESEERFRQLAENSTDAFWFVGLDPERILYVSPAVEKIWGFSVEKHYEDPRAWLSCLHPEDRARVTAAYAATLTGESRRFEAEYRVVRPDGSIRWVMDSGTPVANASGKIIRMGGIAKDITERKRVEGQMLRTQRLESIGTLAGGVAHDLNNSLAPILMSTELLRMQFPESSRVIEIIESSAKRGAEMVRQLLTFAKGIEGARLLVQPHRLLKEMQEIIKGTFPKNIQFEANYSKELQTILGDVTQLHQVLLNLCVNARDAMPNGGTLALFAENAEIDSNSELLKTTPDAKAGKYVVWRVKDTGTGIPPEIIERIFEPFFSTKGPDKGTGLGLSTVIGIVKSHGGFLRVVSEPGKGSTFSVYLPVANASAADAEAPKAAQAAFRGNGETILVVDDEAGVRNITRKVLTNLNFQVITAGDGTEALMQVADKRDELRAVITDLHMPHMDGLSFVRVVKHMLPKAGIIVASGRFDDDDEHQQTRQLTDLGVTAFLEKPFNQAKLVEALQLVFENSDLDAVAH